jgi:hypothetical protein
MVKRIFISYIYIYNFGYRVSILPESAAGASRAAREAAAAAGPLGRCRAAHFGIPEGVRFGA